MIDFSILQEFIELNYFKLMKNLFLLAVIALFFSCSKTTSPAPKQGTFKIDGTSNAVWVVNGKTETMSFCYDNFTKTYTGNVGDSFVINVSCGHNINFGVDCYGNKTNKLPLTVVNFRVWHNDTSVYGTALGNMVTVFYRGKF